jgi:RNA polymerase sigma factor (sigma-70 family)
MQRWERPVKAVIARIVLNTSEAEDLAQETFVRLWQHRDRFNPSQAVKPWILGIAVNLARNRLRWWRRRPSITLDDWNETPWSPDAAPVPHGSKPLEQSEQVRAVRDALAALPPDFREVIVLFEYEGLSYADIALALGTTPKTCRKPPRPRPRETAPPASAVAVGLGATARTPASVGRTREHSGGTLSTAIPPRR